MSKEYIVEGNVLIVTDIHQDIEWFREIMRREEGNYDSYVFGGDMFDSWQDIPHVWGIKSVAEELVEMLAGKYGKGYFIPGNHDLPYMEVWKYCAQFQNAHHIHNTCGGFSNGKAKKINHTLTWEHWRQFKPFYMVNGYLVSHGGLMPQFFGPMLTAEENIDKVWREIEASLELITYAPSPYFSCGFSRGGNTLTPGPFWCDFHEEFEEIPGVPQICGHSGKRKSIRNIGNNYCIDGHQSTYALVSPDGNIQFKSIEKFNGEWMTGTFAQETLPKDRNKISKDWKY